MKFLDTESSDPVAGAFEVVAEVGEETAKDALELAKHSRRASEERAAGATVSETMASGAPKEVLGLVEKMSKRLVSAGSLLRKSLAHGLSSEGWGVGSISRLFGVSHQRISALLKKAKGKS